MSADWPRLLADVAAVESKRKLHRYVEVLELTSHEYIVLVMGDIKQRETKGKKKA